MRTIHRRLKKILGTATDALSSLAGQPNERRTRADGVSEWDKHELFRKPIRLFTQNDMDQCDVLIRELDDTLPERIRVEANRICRHEFDLLGSGPVDLGRRIDWHHDFKTGFSWSSRRHFAWFKQAKFPGGYDIKVPWELSRCQHFARLGQAYWFTKDEKYAQEFTTQVLDWIEQNQPQFGVNWACTMDVAIRAVNWLLGLDFFDSSPSLTDEFRLVFYKSLLTHGRHIYTNLEGGPSKPPANNHYIADLVGLTWLGLSLPFLKESSTWLGYALPELWQEVMSQTTDDGVNFEASIPYHRFVTEMIIMTILMCRRHKVDVPQIVLDRLEQMLDFLHVVTRPDGRLPTLGDQDNGRLARLTVYQDPQQEWVDARGLLVLGAHLYQRLDWLPEADEAWQDAIWLLGTDALQMQTKPTITAEPGSRDFSQAGMYLMRGDGSYVLVDAGSNGRDGNGGHGHNDLFSFELFAGDQLWILDPGSGVYTQDYHIRNTFRSARSHNLVVVDGEEPHPYYERDLWRLPDAGKVKVLDWQADENHAVLSVSHDCYHRLSDPVTYQRSYDCSFSPFSLAVTDEFTAQKSHRYTSYLHLAPHIKVQIIASDMLILETLEGEKMSSKWLVENAVDDPELSIVDGLVSPSYGSYQSSSVICIEWSAMGSTRLNMEFDLKNE